MGFVDRIVGLSELYIRVGGVGYYFYGCLFVVNIVKLQGIYRGVLVIFRQIFYLLRGENILQGCRGGLYRGIQELLLL